ncbi:MAG: DUF4147 domain-containing protein [Promethearchaeota archaeon]|nr:MAG: DUF4147 domain-containing protein [Candidatus Lokiarchaeota archaeon]
MSPSIIKNYSQLLSSELSKPQLVLRKIILNSLELAITSVMPKNLMEESLKVKNGKLIIQNSEFNLNYFKEINIIGGGKAVAHMAAYLEKLLSNIPKVQYNGIINIPNSLTIDDLGLTSAIQVNYASHPIPNEAGINGVLRMKELIKASSKKSLIIFLVSGGGSALLPLPRKNIQIKDLQIMNELLLESGASIHEINIVRKHLSDFKGGNLARLIFQTSQATLISLIISDVIGNNLDSIASGPSVPDSSTFEDVRNILNKYKLFKKIPSTINTLVQEGLINNTLETPKSRDKCFTNVHNFLIGSVESAVHTITNYLKDKGFIVNYFIDDMRGEAREFGEKVFDQFFVNSNEHQHIERYALIGTGELTVTIKGKGIGGRNQEMLLSFLDKTLKNQIIDHFCFMGANLDGIEGNSKAMGALVDNEVQNRALKFDFDMKTYLENNDSNSVFKKLGTEIITGPTGCNVNDVIILLHEKLSENGE